MPQTVLIIAHSFPPMGGPGVHRSLQFVKNLHDYGYHPIVLTVTLQDIATGLYPLDNTLLKEFPENIPIIRVATKEPRKFKKFFNKLKLFRLFWYFLYPVFWEPSALWPLKSYSTAKKIIKENDIKLVYTSSSPFSAMLLGYLLKKKIGVKWIADIRDPFTDAYAWLFPSKTHWYVARVFERWLFSKSDFLIVNTQAVKDLYLKRKIISEKKIVVINNGY